MYIVYCMCTVLICFFYNGGCSYSHTVEDTAILDASLDIVTSRKVRDKMKLGHTVGALAVYVAVYVAVYMAVYVAVCVIRE